MNNLFAHEEIETLISDFIVSIEIKNFLNSICTEGLVLSEKNDHLHFHPYQIAEINNGSEQSLSLIG